MHEQVHLPARQIKNIGDGSGTGGDWGVRLHAERAGDAPKPESQDGTRPPPDRLSMLFYLGDEQVTCFVAKIHPSVT